MRRLGRAVCWPEADPALVSLAELLFGGVQVHVPLSESVGIDAASTRETGAPSTGLLGQPSSADGGASRNAPSDGLINVSTVSLELLTTLPGM